jgi:hypothetical protein
MSSLDYDEHVPAPRYTPSGRFNVFAMAPLLLIGALIALVMGVVLLLLESDFYFYFFTPGLVGLPVFAATWAVVRFSNCRNPLVGSLVGLVLAAIYYAGYWELSYRANIVANGPIMVAMVRQIGGAPGLPGYINFRCMTSKPVHHPGAGAGNAAQPNRVDHVFNYVFFGGEVLLVVGIAVAIGRSWAQRVYYEPERRWSSRLEFRLPPSALGTVLAAIEARNWAAIAALPRVSSMGNANTSSLYFRVEYLAGGVDSPAYLTLGGSNLPKELVSSAGVPKSRLGTFLRQVAVEAPSARGLARHFPEMKLAPPARDEAGPEQATPAAVGEVFDPLAGERPRVKKTAAAKVDFRERAVAATRELLDEGSNPSPGRSTRPAACRRAWARARSARPPGGRSRSWPRRSRSSSPRSAWRRGPRTSRTPGASALRSPTPWSSRAESGPSSSAG